MMNLPAWAAWADLAIRVGWAAVATATAFGMGRRGHDGGMWLLAGLILGPLVVPAAIISAHRAATRAPIIVVGGLPGRGRRDVLLVVPESGPTGPAWLQPFDDLREVLVVAVVGRDTIDVAAREAALRRARASLLRSVRAYASQGILPTAMIVEGRRDIAVASLLAGRGIETVVVPADEAGRALAERLRRRCPSARVVVADEVASREGPDVGRHALAHEACIRRGVA